MIEVRRHNFGWDAASVVLHVALFAALILLTPVRKLVFPEREPAAPPVETLPQEKLENLDEKLAEARSRELQRDLTTLQTVLNDMEVVRDQLHQDFDDVVEDLAADAKDELKKAVEEARERQKEALKEQDEAQKNVDKLAEAEKQDLAQSAQKIEETAHELYWQDYMDVAAAQANAQNALDRVQTAAAFAGYEKVAKAAEELRDAQIAAAKTQSTEAKNILEPTEKLADFQKAAKDKAEAEKKAEEERKNQAENQAKKDKAEAEKNQAAQKSTEAENRRSEAEKQRSQAEDRRREAQNEKASAENEKRQAESRKHDAENRARQAQNEENQAKSREQQAQREENAAKERGQKAESERAAAQAKADKADQERQQAHERAEQKGREQQEAKNRGDSKAEQAAKGAKEQAQRDEKQAQDRKGQAERERQQADQRKAQAEREENQARERKERAQNDAQQAAGRRDEQNRAAAEQNEKAQKAEQAAKAAQEKSSSAERERNDAQKRADQARSERDRAESERRAAENRANDANNRARGAADRAQEQERIAADAQKRMDEARRAAQSLDANAQKARQARARDAQQKVLDAMAKLDAAIESDVAVPKSHVPETLEASELATRNTSDLSISEAYELARDIEEAVTETYREVVAATTALEQHLPLEEAERLTDVAKPVRADIDKELLDGRASDPETFAKQKEARYNAVRETENMVDASMAMLEEAFRLSGAGDSSNYRDRTKRIAQGLKWLKRGDLAGHGETDDRTGQFHALAGLSMQIERAAAEDRSARAKDLRGVQMGGLAQLGAGTKDEDYRRMAGRAGAYTGQPASRQEAGTGPDLVAGNTLSLDPASRGQPAGWMYLNSWWIIGPFPNPDRVNITRKFPPESVIDLDAAYEGQGGLVRWQFTQARSNFPPERFNRHRSEVIPPDRREFAIWYGYTILRVDRECDVWLAAGSDDRSDVWVNGMKVWASGNNRKVWTIDEGFRRIHLHKGANTVLVRLENGPGPTSFSVCVSPNETPPPL
ncbi:MAG: hypothetical protein II839_08485 [Kiritimatiellae bacterium]|nr:hypothetical protein [Kiritimatiellia bacterium]